MVSLHREHATCKVIGSTKYYSNKFQKTWKNITLVGFTSLGNINRSYPQNQEDQLEDYELHQNKEKKTIAVESFSQIIYFFKV